MTELGHKYRDTISGFEGFATGRAVYLCESPSVRITAITGPNSDAKERWIPEERLEVVLETTGAGFVK